MMFKAVVGCAQHPEYGCATIPFPIPHEEYDNTMVLLDGLDIGDTLRQDCTVIELESQYPVLDKLVGAEVDVDEMDYLAKRLDGFCKSEIEQFLAMAHKLDLSDIKDFINLTFCCQETTVISDFSKLEQAGKSHAMNLNGGTLSLEELNAMDGFATALRLIETVEGTVTPYGVVYDNGMELKQFYDGQHFPGYLYEPPVVAYEVLSQENERMGAICLPMPDTQLQRMRLRTEVDSPDTWMMVTVYELPEETADALDLGHLSGDDLPGLNRMCRAIQPMSKAELEKLNAVVLMTEASGITAVCHLAENLDQFDFVPNIQTPEEYGRYMIRESGRFDYDANLDGFYDYRLYGEQRVQAEGGQFNDCGYVAYHGTLPLEELMQDDPAEQYRQEQGPQMSGLV